MSFDSSDLSKWEEGKGVGKLSCGLVGILNGPVRGQWGWGKNKVIGCLGILLIHTNLLLFTEQPHLNSGGEALEDRL